MLHTRTLRYLDAVAREGSIRRAASQLNVSASAINRQILLVEEELGAALFDRMPRRLRLTAAGEAVIAHVRQTLREEERLLERIEKLRGLSRGAVTIAAVHGLAGGVLPPILERFRAASPAVRVTVRAEPVAGIIQALVSGNADIGLGYSPPFSPAIIETATFRTRLGVVVAPGHPLAERSDVRLSDCIGHPAVLADETLTVNALVMEAFGRLGAELRPICVTNSVSLLKTMARLQNAITFLSRIDVAEEIDRGELVYLPILGSQLRSHELKILRRANAQADPAVARLEENIRQSLRARERVWTGGRGKDS